MEIALFIALLLCTLLLLSSIITGTSSSQQTIIQRGLDSKELSRQRIQKDGFECDEVTRGIFDTYDPNEEILGTEIVYEYFPRIVDGFIETPVQDESGKMVLIDRCKMLNDNKENK